MKILVEVMVVEIKEGMAEEDVDEVHNNFTPNSKAEAIEGISTKGGGGLPPTCINQAKPIN